MKKIIAFISLCLIVSISFSQNNSIQEERIKKHVYTLASDSLLGRKAGSIQADMAANYIKKQFENIGIKANFQYLYNNQNFKNVIAIIEGSDEDLKNEYIVIGAHYDHLGFSIDGSKTIDIVDSTGTDIMVDIKVKGKSKTNDTVIFYGADDNASGIAALIELARMLYSNKNNVKRSIVFVAFDAEESGLNGSEYFVSTDLKGINIDNIKLMLNLDMVGYLKKSKKLYINGIGMIDDCLNYFPTINTEEDFKLVFKDFDKSILYGSDHDSFAEKGIPALMFTTGLTSPYHKPTDIADSIDFKGISKIIDFMYSTTNNFANKGFSSSGKVSTKHMPFKKNYLGLNLGVGSNQHFYSSDDMTMTGKTATNLSVGLFGRLELNKNIALKGEVEYIYQKANREEGKVKYHTLSIPLSVVFKASMEKNMIEVNTGLGGFYDYNFRSKLNANNNYLYKHNAGIQYNLELRIYSIVLGFHAKYGIIDLLNKKNLETRSITKMFKIGYVF